MRTAPCQFIEQTGRMLGVLNALAECGDAAREPLFARAEEELKQMRANPSKAAPGFALTFAGLVQCARGDRSAAMRSFATAAADLPKVGGGFFGKRARYLEGVLEGGDTGEDKCAPFVLQVAAQGWTDVELGLDFWIPGRRLVQP